MLFLKALCLGLGTTMKLWYLNQRDKYKKVTIVIVDSFVAQLTLFWPAEEAVCCCCRDITRTISTSWKSISQTQIKWVIITILFVK